MNYLQKKFDSMKKQRKKYNADKTAKMSLFSLHFDKLQTPPILKLQMINNDEERIVIPRALQSKNGKAINQGIVRSLNISRHNIEDEQPKKLNLQFNKKLKAYYKGLSHIRTHSHQNNLCQKQIQDDILSDFSNSLENISSQVIEIPFAKKTFTQTSSHINHEKQNNRKTLEFSRKIKNPLRGTLDKLRSYSAQVKKQVKKINYCKQICKSPQYERNISKLQLKMIPKPKRNIECHIKLSLSEFTLKAMKITRSGSIIYMAIHNKSGGIYALKSIRKSKAKQKINEFILQLKLGLCANHPNINKIYALFQQGDNIYIIKELLQEGAIVDQQRGFNQGIISQYLNHFFYGVMKIQSMIDLGHWYTTPFQMAKSYGIIKITNISFAPNYNQKIFSQQMTKTIEYFFDSDRRSTFDCKSTEMLKSSHFSLNQTVLTSFLQIFQKILTIDQSTLHLFWQHPFLKQSRFKSIMQE